jgi:hypothetical protein
MWVQYQLDNIGAILITIRSYTSRARYNPLQLHFEGK